jgi:predicted metal-dependent enzyme (double-stranded beta helix superfamily)
VLSDGYTLAEYIADLRTVTSEHRDDNSIISAVRPLAKRLALSRTWIRPQHYECDEEQGFGIYLLHEEADHALAVLAVNWLPGRGTLPHDHGTWAVVAGVEGPERNVFWERIDDRSREGYAELKQIGDKVFEAGDVVAMPPGTIHSVVNESDAVTLSLHTYGMHVNYTGRSKFDPDAKLEMPYIVDQKESAGASAG